VNTEGVRFGLDYAEPGTPLDPEADDPISFEKFERLKERAIIRKYHYHPKQFLCNGPQMPPLHTILPPHLKGSTTNERRQVLDSR